MSMSDGRVMCYLLHYYHPSLLREKDICQETTQTCNPYTADDSIDDDSLNAKDESLACDQGTFNLANLTARSTGFDNVIDYSEKRRYKKQFFQPITLPYSLFTRTSSTSKKQPLLQLYHSYFST